jgi:hypothetical protein
MTGRIAHQIGLDSHCIRATWFGVAGFGVGSIAGQAGTGLPEQPLARTRVERGLENHIFYQRLMQPSIAVKA